MASITRRSAPCASANAAARSRLASSSRSIDGDVLRLNAMTCANLPVAAMASTNAAPIPPLAPKMTATPASGIDRRSDVATIAVCGGYCAVTGVLLPRHPTATSETAQRSGIEMAGSEETVDTPPLGRPARRAAMPLSPPSATRVNESKPQQTPPLPTVHVHRVCAHENVVTLPVGGFPRALRRRVQRHQRSKERRLDRCDGNSRSPPGKGGRSHQKILWIGQGLTPRGFPAWRIVSGPARGSDQGPPHARSVQRGIRLRSESSQDHCPQGPGALLPADCSCWRRTSERVA